MVVISEDSRAGLASLRCGSWEMLKPMSDVRHVNKNQHKGSRMAAIHKIKEHELEILVSTILIVSQRFCVPWSQRGR